VALALQADGWYLRSDIIWAKSNCMPESVTDRPTRSHEYIFLMTKSKKYFYDHEAIKEPCIYDVDGTGTQARKARSEGNKRLPTSERNGIRPIKSHQEFTRDHPDRAENSKYKNGGYKNATKFEGKNKGNEKLRGHPRQQWDTTGFLDQASKQEQCTGMRNKRDVWMIAPANYPEAHFATFPPELIKPCILAGTKPGDIVLDPFAGSGTTGMVSIELGRKAVLIELNEKYIELIKQRTNTTVGFRF
jgi:site-specific DNA-methyltransferase (adenine-specific)